MLRLSQILQQRDMFSVQSNETVAEVARKMAELRIGAILVLEGDRLRGIFSERDLMTRVVVPGLDPGRTMIDAVMTSHLATSDDEATVDQAMEIMHRQRCRHLPVLCSGRPIGLISMRDLMSLDLERKTEELEHMRAYIQSV